jgi:hypothetical protein
MYTFMLSDHWRGPAARAMISRASAITLDTGEPFGFRKGIFGTSKLRCIMVTTMCSRATHTTRRAIRQDHGGRVRNSGDDWQPIGQLVAKIIARAGAKVREGRG